MKTFQELQQGNQFVSGTNESIRYIVMSNIIKVNKYKMTIMFSGLKLELTANWSLSKKTVTWDKSLTQDEYIKLTGSIFGYSKKNNNASISIDMTGRVTIYGGGNYYENVRNNKDIIIL